MNEDYYNIYEYDLYLEMRALTPIIIINAFLKYE